MGQDLINATPEHDITAQQHRDQIRITDHARPPPPTNQSRAMLQIRRPVLRRSIRRYCADARWSAIGGEEALVPRGVALRPFGAAIGRATLGG